MIWHVVFAEPDRLPRSRAARSRDAAIHAACELLAEGNDVRRIVEPSGVFIERAELDEHHDGGRFPGLRIPSKSASVLSSSALYERAQLGHHVGRIERARGLKAGMGGRNVDGEFGIA
jgi:hypothetical protein